MHVNWNTFLESSFFLSFFFHQLENFCCSSGHSVYLSLKSQKQFSTDRIPFFSCFSHTLPQPLPSPDPRGCMWGALLPAAPCGEQGGGRPPTVLGSSGCRGGFSFLSTRWHLLVLGSRDHTCNETALLLHFQNKKPIFPWSPHYDLPQSPSCSPLVQAVSWPVVLVCFCHTGQHLPTKWVCHLLF